MEVRVANRQRKVRIDLPFLCEVTKLAVARCLQHPLRTDAPLLSLEGIDVAVLSDSEIERINEQFLDHRYPTDVITFDHGEILLGAGVASANAKRFRKPVDEELALYIIHGLLHLNGWSDHR